MALWGMKITNQFSDLKNDQIEILLEACEMLATAQESRDDGLTEDQMATLGFMRRQLGTLYWYRVLPDQETAESAPKIIEPNCNICNGTGYISTFVTEGTKTTHKVSVCSCQE